MHARVTHSKSDPAKIDESIRFIKETVVPNAKKNTGYKGGYWLGDRTTGKGISFTLWESEAAMKSSDETAKGTVEKATAMGIQITGVERYEVLHQD
jgi:hypothetical protein